MNHHGFMVLEVAVDRGTPQTRLLEDSIGKYPGDIPIPNALTGVLVKF